jgi:DNA-directed RNA polymerase specialized sigma24 family protein
VTTALEDIDTPDQATDTQPEQAFAAREVYAAIATLPELFRVALVALDVFSLSYSQAARSVRAREG